MDLYHLSRLFKDFSVSFNTRIITKQQDEEKQFSHSSDDFVKSNNDRRRTHTRARASEQWYISIYIFLWMKTFLKTGVYIYIYIYIYICSL